MFTVSLIENVSEYTVTTIESRMALAVEVFRAIDLILPAPAFSSIALPYSITPFLFNNFSGYFTSLGSLTRSREVGRIRFSGSCGKGLPVLHPVLSPTLSRTKEEL
jgi:hypothetical protein